MALPRDYAGQACSLARSLELVGERWTLLIVRDAFYGVRRFSDFLVHLGIPRAVLTERLAGLVTAGVLERVPGPGGHDEYATTEKGLALWPAVRALTAWGDAYCAERGPRRVFRHVPCDAVIDTAGACPVCGSIPGPDTLAVLPGPGLAGEAITDPVTAALATPHRMLQPLDTRRERTGAAAAE